MVEELDESKVQKCVKYNIKKYEDLNKLPNANTEYNNQVINLLKAKSTLESDCLTGRAKNGLSKGGMKQEYLRSHLSILDWLRRWAR